MTSLTVSLFSVHLTYFVHSNNNNNTVKWNRLSSEDKILIKICVNLEDFLPDDSSRNILTKIEKTNIGWLSANDTHNQFDRMHCGKHLTPVPWTTDIFVAVQDTNKMKM